jgi:ParB/RepB/Spo0J family partition protein
MNAELHGISGGQNDFEQGEKLTITEGPMNKSGPISIQNMPLNKIKLAKNSRLNVSDEEIAGMMQSIKEVGLLQPIGVSKSGTGYEICYGNRRFMACSKLGMKRIPVIIHTNKTEIEGDLKNLTENLQRRNISLSEAGRYMQMLRESGLSAAEIAVRLGVSKSYIQHCLNAFSEVPAEFRDDLEMRTTMDKKKTPGKIPITTATAILSAKKSHNLKAEDVRKLFKSAKSDDAFSVDNLPRYVSAIKQGKKDPVKETTPLKHMKVQFYISLDHYEELERRHVQEGPFQTMNGLFVAILKGEKSQRVKVVGKGHGAV